MGVFDIFKKKLKPYNDPSINSIYELLFCDDLNAYKEMDSQADKYPWNSLFAEASPTEDLNKILSDTSIESRIKILAYNKLRSQGQNISEIILLGVIVEIGLDKGLDVLASYHDGTARYINQTGKMIVWDAADEKSVEITNTLFKNAYHIMNNIGPWDKPRRPAPDRGTARLTFLVSDGLYFGEGPINVLFNDPMAGPALASAAELMKYLIEKAS